MPRDEWKREADRIKYGHREPVIRSRRKLKKKQLAVATPRLQNLNTKLWFGKYKNMTIREVQAIDPGYLRWLASTSPSKHAWRMKQLQQFLKSQIAHGWANG